MHMLLMLLQQPVSDVVKSALNNNALLGAGKTVYVIPPSQVRRSRASPKPRPTSAAR